MPIKIKLKSDSEEVDEDINLEEPLGQAMSHANKGNSVPHDILSTQVSTVASESAFSASGRILDPYRNSLALTIVEALVYTQDWICTSSKNITMDTLEDLMKDNEFAKGEVMEFC
ncbi:zinc finger BED domain-containing protein RICESLEEPER 2 [Tanacetum coccineum]